jgi:hypothetical protein
MIVGIDIDDTLSAFPEFFIELGNMIRSNCGKVYIITGLGYDVAHEKLKKYPTGFYDDIVTTQSYNEFERSLIGKIHSNEMIVGIFKQRVCKELNVDIMFDDQALYHRHLGDVPIFDVRQKKFLSR